MDGQVSDFSDSILPRGFTGHEHFAEITLIHMNGRMYDPQLRRFLSPDNNIIDPYDTRSFDRFAYGFHNPLMNIDISGENFFRAIGDWFQRNSKLITFIAQISAAVVATVLTAGMTSPILAGAIVGASTGLVGGFVRTLTQGGNIGQALYAGGIEMLIGGATGALTAGLFKLGQSERIFKNVKIGEVKLSETKVGQALGKFLSKENSNKTLFKMLNKSVSIERAVIGTLTFGAHIGGQSGLRKSLDNHYTKFWEKDKGGVSIEDVTKVQRDQNSGTSSSGSNEYVADNSNYGELYGETPDPFDRSEANFIDRAASAIEHLASGSGGVNYNTFTAGGMGSGMGYPEGEEEDNEEEEEEEEEENEEEENPCGTGFVQDINGKCWELPCPGDPVPNPRIAPQKGPSGILGGIFGCTRFGGTCQGEDNRDKFHGGIDFKAEYGDPIFAMYDGFIYSAKDDSDGAGYYTRLQSTIDGETFIHEYFHLQENNRILPNTDGTLRYVNAGDIIGYLGDSGNLAGAITLEIAESHLHSKIKKHDGSSNWNYKNNFITVDPRDYVKTIINDDGTTVQENTNCN